MRNEFGFEEELPTGWIAVAAILAYSLVFSAGMLCGWLIK